MKLSFLVILVFVTLSVATPHSITKSVFFGLGSKSSPVPPLGPFPHVRHHYHHHHYHGENSLASTSHKAKKPTQATLSVSNCAHGVIKGHPIEVRYKRTYHNLNGSAVFTFHDKLNKGVEVHNGAAAHFTARVNNKYFSSETFKICDVVKKDHFGKCPIDAEKMEKITWEGSIAMKQLVEGLNLTVGSTVQLKTEGINGGKKGGELFCVVGLLKFE